MTGAGLDQAVDPGSYVRAILNILADFSDERAKLADVQKAVLNILEDFAGEKARLEATQKAVLNILEDFEVEKNKVEQINRDMVREIGERKQAEEALEAANKELGAFSYSVSHDLRAPLRAMDGFARILVEDYGPHLDPQAQRYLHLVRDNARQMGQLVDDLLGFSRLGRQPLKKQPVAPGELVRQALAELREEQEERGIELKIGELPPCQADPALLRQVFVNLLSNALKYTRDREKAVIEVGWREGAYFVRDNGTGFDMRYAHKLFGVFQRLHRAEEYEGTGVGLAIVQRIVHRHNGRVWAEAELDKGATFYFTIGGERHD